MTEPLAGLDVLLTAVQVNSDYKGVVKILKGLMSIVPLVRTVQSLHRSWLTLAGHVAYFFYSKGKVEMIGGRRLLDII